MIVTGIAPTESTAQSRARSREKGRAEEYPTGFSAPHIILDLSLEAMRQIGYEPLAPGRPPQPLLFVYTGKGEFAYDEAAKRYQEAHRRAVSRLEAERLRAETAVRETAPEYAETLLPSTVSFDGMLGLGF